MVFVDIKSIADIERFRKICIYKSIGYGSDSRCGAGVGGRVDLQFIRLMKLGDLDGLSNMV
ncbi:hypothetical protein KR52_09430 [Synechococcus sp. KORDI-52]|nr:hypothetical protein KR52_09430 [Synechococcus sp. KORDI-52]